jgi:uncharacterized protein (TIRG00374 family)
MAQSTKRKSTIVPGVLLGVMALLLVALVVFEWDKTGPALRQSHWQVLPWVLLFAFSSYAFASAGFAVISRTFGVSAGAGRLLLVGFINMAVNNLLTLGGAAGYAVSAVLLRDGTTRARDVLSASLFNSYVYFAFGTTLLPVSLAYVLLTHHLSPNARLALTVVTGAATALAVVVHTGVFSARFRAALLRLLAAVARKLVRRDLAGPFAEFDQSFSRGVKLLRERGTRTAAVLAAVTCDWVCCLVALQLCFSAFGPAPSPAVTASGFFVGIAAGGASMIPGGLGVQEGSMAGTYVLLGVGLGQALLSSILFRALYYLVPFGVGLVLYLPALRRGKPINRVS